MKIYNLFYYISLIFIIAMFLQLSHELIWIYHRIKDHRSHGYTTSSTIMT